MLTLPVGAPGVYIREVTGPATIAGVGTGTAAFIGPAVNGPFGKPIKITNFDQFKRLFGSSDAEEFPYLTTIGRRYYMAYGVSGFFANGGQQAVIVRIGTATAASLQVFNGNTEVAFVIQARVPGAAGNGISAGLAASAAVPVATVSITDEAGTLTGSRFVTDDKTPAAVFKAGDEVDFVPTGANYSLAARVTRVEENGTVVVLDKGQTTSLGVQGLLSTRAIQLNTVAFRVPLPIEPALAPGALLGLTFDVDSSPPVVPLEQRVAHAYVESVSSDGVVRLQGLPEPESGFTEPIRSFNAAQIVGFTLTVTANGATEAVADLSLSPLSPRYVFRHEFLTVEVLAPEKVPAAKTILTAQPLGVGTTLLSGGADDRPAMLSAAHYEAALESLRSVDGINLVCIPDAAFAGDGGTIERRLVDHCVRCRDRFAILDTLNRIDPLVQRRTVTATGGFAALYYPHVLVEEQLTRAQRESRSPEIIAIPPSGHIAGVYARVDAEGVHVAPANQEIQGVLGVSVSVANDEQGPLNRAGVDVLRVFADDGRVLVWGARTTAPEEQTDWRYVNVRRLLTFIELSLDRSLRWAVFRPNDRSLWTSLQVTISEFLRKQWRQGALVGVTEAQAFRVRIDEGLNPPSEMALGVLNIEIRVAPSHPAEFIVINIGLSQQGTEIRETP